MNSEQAVDFSEDDPVYRFFLLVQELAANHRAELVNKARLKAESLEKEKDV